MPGWVGAGCLLGSLGTLASVEVRDDLGQPVSLPRPASRIISLSPHLTEHLFALGAGDRIVGTVSYSDYPPAARDIPLIGSNDAFDLERIRALHPDLIVAWPSGNPVRALEQLRTLGIPMFQDNVQQLAQVPEVMERLGVLTGQAGMAGQRAQDFRARMSTLRQQHAGQRPVRVFYQVWDKPLMTLNGRHILSDVLQLCGAVNVFAALPALVPTVDEEAVLAANPDLIVASGKASTQAAWARRWQRWPHLKAVAAGQVVMLPPDLLSRMGPRLIEGAEALCRAVAQARR